MTIGKSVKVNKFSHNHGPTFDFETYKNTLTSAQVTICRS